MQVEFLKPAIREADIQAAADAIRSGWLVLGEQTREFEAEFAAYLGAKHAIMTNSCACSLELMLEIMGIGPGDEVITTPLTYVSSVAPILRVGAKPVFVEVEAETGLMNLDLLEAAITPATKAILPVHLYGLMVDMKRLQEIAKAHNLLVLEDAAHAIEAEREGVRSAQLGGAACFSFHSAKNLAAGYGGMIVTNDDDYAERARLLRKDGVRPENGQRYMYELGHKYLATEYQAALLRGQLARIDDSWQERERCYKRYQAAFDDLNVKYNVTVPGAKHAYHMMVLWLDADRREGVQQALSEAGVQTSIHYNPVHLEPYFVREFGYTAGAFPIAEKLGYGALTLPLYPDLTDEEIDYVIKNYRLLITDYKLRN